MDASQNFIESPVCVMFEVWTKILELKNGPKLLMKEMSKLMEESLETKDASRSLADKVLLDIEEKKELREAIDELKKEIESKDQAIGKLEREMKKIELKIIEHEAKEVATKETQTSEVKSVPLLTSFSPTSNVKNALMYFKLKRV